MGYSTNPQSLRLLSSYTDPNGHTDLFGWEGNCVPSDAQRQAEFEAKKLNDLVGKCRIPDDYIDKNRYPLFMARQVLRELVQSLQSTGSLSCA